MASYTVWSSVSVNFLGSSWNPSVVYSSLLRQPDVPDGRLFLKLSHGRFVERLILVHEAARQRPVVMEGLVLAPDEEHLEHSPDDGEEHHVGGDEVRRGFHVLVLQISRAF